MGYTKVFRAVAAAIDEVKTSAQGLTLAFVKHRVQNYRFCLTKGYKIFWSVITTNPNRLLNKAFLSNPVNTASVESSFSQIKTTKT